VGVRAHRGGPRAFTRPAARDKKQREKKELRKERIGSTPE